MKCSESWLREWVNPALSRDELCDKLTMSGFEVEECAPIAGSFTGVVIGEVIQVEKHPEADRLHLCEVNIGKEKLKIVCGAANVREKIKVPVALINAVIADGTEIKPTKIRGVESHGMLCSAAELGMADESQGLFILADDAPVGENFRKYLNLDDYTIDISITPNRGDCLSVNGLAREVAAIANAKLHEITIPEIKAAHQDVLPLQVKNPADCPHYVGRVIRHVNAAINSPAWLKEKLRRSGVRSISAIVDVTNYVMLELGQPMHAFDLKMIADEMIVRQANASERIHLLDGSEKELDAETLVIADRNQPLAIAGVMGGLDSGVTLLTQDIFIESAYFNPQTVARQRQFYNLNSDSAYRFERGVDHTIQRKAIERATQLILEIAGGEPGNIIEFTSEKHLPINKKIILPVKKIETVLGIAITDEEVKRILSSLNFKTEKTKSDWVVHIPSYRFDIELAEDVIEEIARLYGYDHIPAHRIHADLQVDHASRKDNTAVLMKNILRDQGFHEIISYSFIDKKLHELFSAGEICIELLNPISSEMAVMRTNLWPGLVSTLLYNQSRQQQRVHLFEHGTCFVKTNEGILQQPRIAGIISGFNYPEQWGTQSKIVDFYDLKGNVENLLKTFCHPKDLLFVPDQHPALHPGQTAAIYIKNSKIGMMGQIHPLVLQALDLEKNVFVFELSIDQLGSVGYISAQEISKFPEIRRDLAILIKQAIPSKNIQDTIRNVAGDWLKDVFIFDVYQGKGILPGLKSVALGLILQHPSRTLVDEEVAGLMTRVINALKVQLGAELRS